MISVPPNFKINLFLYAHKVCWADLWFNEPTIYSFPSEGINFSHLVKHPSFEFSPPTINISLLNRHTAKFMRLVSNRTSRSLISLFYTFILLILLLSFLPSPIKQQLSFGEQYTDGRIPIQLSFLPIQSILFSRNQLPFMLRIKCPFQLPSITCRFSGEFVPVVSNLNI